jgi:hypothetical protein
MVYAPYELTAAPRCCRGFPRLALADFELLRDHKLPRLFKLSLEARDGCDGEP